MLAIVERFRALFEHRGVDLQPRAFVIGLRPWKKFIVYWLPHERVVRISRWITSWRFHTIIGPLILTQPGSKVYVWGYKAPRFVDEFCRRHSIPLIRIEDGFIRSVKLGAKRTPPLSLCFDQSGMYFDATCPSDLEHLLQTYDFAADPALLQRARCGIEKLINSRLSKYNTSESADISEIYGPKTRKRVLVVGQVEGDASIEKGCSRKIDNNDLVRIAFDENPDAQIIYKPHPEILHGTRPKQSNPYDVRHLCLLLEQDIALADAFETVDHVYTITSLSGFEALIRGIKVTCIGMPFYAGWGVTDDRQECRRRTARRTVEEIFAAAYILYARYFDPILKKELTFEQALDLLGQMKMEQNVHERSRLRRLWLKSNMRR
ncbi:capsular polysaccharide biosynthesis protein [Rhizobium sp. NTR19]|uniref:Capsular polysaccharide biosynthesis protein n=1 Tax=Neorhizobium turbinariae TaxID=2937795 RepID=A0ABT0IRV3_9HYPH|nr:capsular polysaccharide biosynthesis protein [Neorhizobium turbinariae]MCK8780589.1 capsular polysaccharide biosynthesis protein [Neorhizobium turbinariae]